MNPKVESLGRRLMKDYIKVGFEENSGDVESAKEGKKSEIEDMVGSIPQQVK